ncbi:MAG TPA: hypothetical protein VE781_05120 [Kineosporiaceae bacterium]|nr:hypothetical protein [Kineosporiaceae bacterium]
MTSRTPHVPEDERASSVGATGGLPGANASPLAAEMDPADLDSTVAAGDAPGSVPDPADAFGDVGSGSEVTDGGDLARREGDLDADGGEADAEASTQAGLS